VFHGDASRLIPAGCRLDACALGGVTFAHAQQALRIAQAIAERRPALTLWVSCRSTTAACFRAMLTCACISNPLRSYWAGGTGDVDAWHVDRVD
jgi:hypothetical protein